jgi:twin BRCT domain
VRRSYTLGERQPERFYSTDPARIFSGKILHASRLSKQEAELLYGAVQSLGGGYKLSLTKEVTHLITPVEDSTKLLVLRVGREVEDAGILAVHPAWVNESIKYNCLMDPTPFAWPLDAPGKPPLLLNIIREPPFYAQNDKRGSKLPGGASSTSGDRLPPADAIASIYGSKELFTPQHSEEQHMAGGDPSENAAQSEKDKKAASKNGSAKKFFKHPYAFQGKRILYAVKHPNSDSDSTHGMRGLDMLAYKIKSHGGEWVPPPFADASIETAVMQADVVITSHRDEPAACYAFWHGKQLTTINWVWSVMTSGRLVSSLDNVLHFPPPSGTIPGFDNHVITVSNYTGENRSYLKNLITQMGARWTPDMSSANTLCVSCSLTGQKVTKASEWHIPIVNHFWLEDCYVRWQVLDRSEAAYRDFAPGVNLQKIVGGTHLDTDLLKPWAKQAEEYTKRVGRQQRQGENFYGMNGEARASVRSSQARKQQLEEQDFADASKLALDEEAMQRIVDETVMPDKTMDVGETTSTKSRKGSAAAAAPAKKGFRKKAQEASKEQQQVDEEMEIEAAVELEEEAAPKPKKQAKAKGKAAATEAKPEKPFSHKKKRARESEESTAGSKAANVSVAGSVTASAKKKPRTAGSKRYYATTMADSITDTVSKNFRASLDWELVDFLTEECEVLVAGKLNRSEKTLCAILRGIDIVTEDWVFDSITAEKTLGELNISIT